MLHEEEVVVDKQAVPKERVRLDKDVVTDEQQVSETVRKEQIDVDGDADAASRQWPGVRDAGPLSSPEEWGSGGGARARPSRTGCCARTSRYLRLT